MLPIQPTLLLHASQSPDLTLCDYQHVIPALYNGRMVVVCACVLAAKAADLNLDIRKGCGWHIISCKHYVIGSQLN